MQTTVERTVKIKQSYSSVAWTWMRYSGLLLIPLAWIHVALQDVIVGVHAIDINYVAARWMNLGWRVFDFALLAFAFAHGVNGLRQVLADFVKSETTMNRISWVLLVFWLVVSAIGGIAIIGGVQGV